MRRLVRWWHHERWLWDVGGGRWQNWWYSRPRPIVWWRHRRWLKRRPPFTPEDIKRLEKDMVEHFEGPIGTNLQADSPLWELFGSERL